MVDTVPPNAGKARTRILKYVEGKVKSSVSQSRTAVAITTEVMIPNHVALLSLLIFIMYSRLRLGRPFFSLTYSYKSNAR